MALWSNWPKFFRSFQEISVCDWKIPPKTGWNTVKGNVFDFSNNSISSALQGCYSVFSNCLILHPIKSMFFNELSQFVEDGLSSWANPTLRQHNSPVFFVSWLANLQHNISWTFSEVLYLLFHRAKYRTTELSSACQGAVSTNLLKYEDIYVSLYCLIVEFFSLWKRHFFSMETFFTFIDNDFLDMLQILPLTYFDE